MSDVLQNDLPEQTPPEQNADMTRRNMLLGAGLLAVSGITFARLPQSHNPRLPKGTFDKLIPTTIGDWKFRTSSGLVLPPPDPLSDKLYSEVMTRLYLAPNMPPLGLLIAYSNVQNGLLQLHRPEVCYPVGGYKLSNTVVSRLDLAPDRDIPIRTFSAMGVTHSEQVLYWTRVGADLPTSWTAQRIAVAEANLRAEIPDGILVRLSLVTQEMSAQSKDIMEDFIRNMLDKVAPNTRKLLIGRSDIG